MHLDMRLMIWVCDAFHMLPTAEQLFVWPTNCQYSVMHACCCAHAPAVPVFASICPITKQLVGWPDKSGAGHNDSHVLAVYKQLFVQQMIAKMTLCRPTIAFDGNSIK